MKKDNIKFYGVEEVHTLQVPDDEDMLYAGMQVQGTTRGKKHFVLIFTPEQVIEMYDYLLERSLEKQKEQELRNGK